MLIEQIVLVRHGKPAWKPGRWIAGAELAGWSAGRDAAPLDPAFPPRSALLALSRRSATIAASPLRRSIESAQMLRPATPPLIDEHFREVPTPGDIGSGIRLRADVWVGIARLRWRLGWSAGVETLEESRRRAATAALRLEALALEHGSVLLAGHGIMNGMIGRCLRQAGWRGPVFRGRRYWAFRVFRKER
ncbi:MAG TPA: histidine phosphatase family protein [Gemmatimonadales bacterium]|nr:histidine phosphatase family protein [Gemmatimonadales bacterium]